MKYKAIIDTDDYKDFKFFEDGNGKYMVGMDVGATSSGGWIPLYFIKCQESVFDKIRNDIKRMMPMNNNSNWFTTDLIPANKVLKIIDKYEVESENKR